MRGLRLAARIDDVHLRRHLVAGAEPRLRHQREDVVGVVADEQVGRADRELLERVPDSLVGARLAEVVPGRSALSALLGDDAVEDRGHRVDDGQVLVRPGEHDDPWSVRQGIGELGLKGTSVAGSAIADEICALS